MNDSNAIYDEEFLYRRVPNCGWYDPDRMELKPDAFRPRHVDLEGLSIERAVSLSHPEFRTVEQAAIGPAKKGYYVAILKVGDLRLHGFTVVPDPLDGNPGHALLIDLIYSKPRDPRVLEKMVLLAHELVVRVEGPFNVETGEKE